jgi:alpha-glucosidase
MMGDYTLPGRLHQCYSFEMMGYDYTPAFFRDRVRAFFAGAPQGWPMWAFGNHDVPRQVTRWAKAGAGDDVARQAAALLLSLQGSVCLWQGEELGQTDTELAFDELTDPQGIAFWPAPVGRDGTRTPMVWDGTSQGGFTTARPWLPVKPPQAARHAAGQQGQSGSVLETYRALLAFRRDQPALKAGDTEWLDAADPVLMFRRTGARPVTCIFNLSTRTVKLPVTGKPSGPSQAADHAGGTLTLGPNGYAFLT